MRRIRQPPRCGGFRLSAAICFAKLRFRLANSWLSLPLARLISGCVRGCRLFSCADFGPFRLPRHLSQPRQSSQFLGSVHTFGSSRTSPPARTPRSVFAPRRLAVSVLVWRGRFRWRVAAFLFCVFCRKNLFFIKKTPKIIKKHRKRTKNNKKSLNRSVYSVSQPPPCGGVPSVVAVVTRRPRCGGSLVQYYPTQPPRITCFLVRPCPSVLGKKP